ncbi:MAG: hypothetical protein WA154_01235 [Moraxellaceae bacterium]
MNSAVDQPLPSLSGLDDLKQLVCIATLGINDADRVLVKAYFRLLLRLDYEINWVAATDPHADLLLVSRGLSYFEKTQDFLQSLRIPILYVEPSRSGVEGGLENNVLTLPLLDTQLLQIWLGQHVALLSSALASAGSSSKSAQASAPVDTVQPLNPPSEVVATPIDVTANQYITELHKLIVFLQQPQVQPRYVTLYDQYRLRIGVVDTVQQQFWIQQAGNFKLTEGWSLKLGLGANDPLRPRGEVVDLKQWLWEALSAAKSTTRLISVEQLVHLTHWPKPQANASRRQVLRVLALLARQPMSVRRVAQILHLPVSDVHQIMASLYGSGCATLGQTVQDWNPDHTATVQTQPSGGLRKLLSSLRNSLRL